MLCTCIDASVSLANCNDGELRLVGGNDSAVGRIEVCINKAWGTICNTRFGTNEAFVICQQLGFPTEGTTISLILSVYVERL